jgi:hypothetical protein
MRLAAKEEIEIALPGFEIGALPPFGGSIPLPGGRRHPAALSRADHVRRRRPSPWCAADRRELLRLVDSRRRRIEHAQPERRFVDLPRT